MGNQPSSPSAPPPPPQAPAPPPIPPPCDMECQRNQELANLKTALDQASANKASDPDGYERARIAYFTLLKGQGWLQKEKKKIGDSEVAPLVKNYTDKYNGLKEEVKMQSMYVTMTDALTAQEGADQSTNAYLNKQLHSDKSQAMTLNRLNALGGQQTAWMPRIMEGIIAILGLMFLYTLFSKRNSILGMFSSAVPNVTVPTVLGGKW